MAKLIKKKNNTNYSEEQMFKLIDSAVLTADLTTAWCNQYGTNTTYQTPFKDFGIQVNWEALTGVANGTIEVLGTLGGDITTIIDTFTIDSTDNSADAHLFSITGTVVSAVKLRYTKNGVTSILLNATLSIIK